MVEPELGDDLRRGLHQRRIVERREVHREPGAHGLARLRVAQGNPALDGDPVDRPLVAGGELHHEQLGAALRRQQLEQLLELHRRRDAGAVREQLLKLLANLLAAIGSAVALENGATIGHELIEVISHGCLLGANGASFAHRGGGR